MHITLSGLLTLGTIRLEGERSRLVLRSMTYAMTGSSPSFGGSQVTCIVVDSVPAWVTIADTC